MARQRNTRPAEIITIANLKGGVGKSTIAINLAAALTVAGKSAVVIDADTQGTSSFWEMQHRLPVTARAMPLDDRAEGRGFLNRLFQSEAVKERTRARNWKRAIEAAGEDYVLIDCPPHVGLATRAAISIAHIVLVPVTASTVDVAATAPALHLIKKARQVRKDRGPRCLMVPSKIDRSTATGRGIEKILAQFGEPVGPALCQRVAFADSVAFGKWAGTYAPDSAAHREVTALAQAVTNALANPVGRS